MFNYCICTVADNEIYKRQCLAFEKHIPLLEKGKEIEDVDGSLIQKYRLGEHEIKVINSVYEDNVRVESDTDIKGYFK